MSKKRLLIVDDNPGFYDTFRDRNEGQWEVVCQDNYIRGVSNAKSKKWQAVIVDLGLPPLNYDGGIKKVLMPIVAAAEKRFPVLVLSADNRPDTPMRVRELGADVFLQKGKTDDQILLTTLEDSIRRFGRKSFEDQFVARSAVMEQIKQRLRTLVNYTDQPVLITGETGTGKDMAARYLHACKDDGKLKFVPVNIAGLTPTLQSSELFGHVKGAFTGAMGNKSGLFAEAQNGTLFLDEIGEMPINLQAKLLRALQEKTVRPVGGEREEPVDVRIIAATHRHLEKEIEQENFRSDLFYRLETFSLRIPPLRERGTDIEHLVFALIDKHAEAQGKQIEQIEPEALNSLLNYTYPGNVRELENAVMRAVTLSEAGVLQHQDLPERLREQSSQQKSSADSTPTLSGEVLPGTQIPAPAPARWPSLEEVEKRYIRKVLEATGGNKRRTAEVLGIARRTLYRRLEDSEE